MLESLVKQKATISQYLTHSVSREAEPVEDESPEIEEEEEKEDIMPMTGEEGETPVVFLNEEGSGGYEGSASEGPFTEDRVFAPAESETGSGESWAEKDTDLFKGNLSFSLLLHV